MYQSTFSRTHSSELIKQFRELMAESGADPELINAVIKTKVIKNFPKLYQNYKRLIPCMRQTIGFVWQLLCLSGEEKALDYACEKYHLSKNTRHIRGENALHYATLSGAHTQVDKALKLGIPWDSEIFNGANIIHFAILSGNPTQLQKVLEIEKVHNKQLSLVTKKGRNVLHYAASTGSIEMVETVLNLIQSGKWKIDIHAKDIYDFNAMNYAIYKSNQSVIKILEQAGIKAMPNQDNFSFGEIDTRMNTTKRM